MDVVVSHDQNTFPASDPPSTIQTWQGRKRNRSGPFHLQQCCARTRGPARRPAVQPEKTYGAGKTTIVRILLALLRHTGTAALVGGCDTHSGPICAAQLINTVAWLSAQIGGS